MNCPVCNRKHTAALSICPSCGAMINDSVREELIVRISARLKPFKSESTEKVEIKEKPMPIQNQPIAAEPVPAGEISKPVTANIEVKATNPTLVEFHNKNSAVPEWRLQLQNAVRQRQGQANSAPVIEEPIAAPRAKLVTSGANALKAEVVETPQPVLQKNPDLARALDRIQKSRQQFLVAEEPAVIEPEVPAKAGKNHSLYIASKTNEADIKLAQINPPISSLAKPKLTVATAATVGKSKLDTNKLPPLDEKIAENFAEKAVGAETANPIKTEKRKSFFAAFSENLLGFSQKLTAKTEIVETIEVEETEEYEDCPTFAMRFNSGLFDLIIGAFASLCLLSPFMLMGGDWLSGAGFFAFAATFSVVMFVYMTLAVGFYGRTFGMRLFSLELIDIEGEEYPTFHQAAVSSSVYLLSLAFCGLGFVTVFFNQEKRAAHDLVSKTIIVKE